MIVIVCVVDPVLYGMEGGGGPLFWLFGCHAERGILFLQTVGTNLPDLLLLPRKLQS